MAIKQEKHYVVVYDQGDCRKQFLLVKENGSKVSSESTLDGIMAAAKNHHGISSSQISVDIPGDVLERVRVSNIPGRHIYPAGYYINKK